jgi:hypothetical protein
VTALTAAANVSPYTTIIHGATRCRFQQKGITTMTNIQTNQIEALSDAELDNVNGGSIGLSLHAIFNALHHPQGNVGFIVSESASVAKSVVKGFFSRF